MSKVFSEGSYKIFSEGKQKSYLKKYLQSQIEECDKQIGECNFILTSDSDDIMTEDRIQAHRKLEVIQYRRFWFYKQLDSFENQ
jgi:hypothetical protein